MRRCIGSTTFDEFRQHFEKDRALARRFQRVEVNEPSLDDCVAILEGLSLEETLLAFGLGFAAFVVWRAKRVEE